MHYLFSCKHPARDYPPINPQLFQTSAQKAKLLLNEANLVMNKIISSHEFSKRLMTAAQESNHAEVVKIITSAGVTQKPDIKYNPDGIILDFRALVQGEECCHIILKLRWE